MMKQAEILLASAVKKFSKLTSTCFFTAVVISEAALKKLPKGEVINLANFDMNKNKLNEF